MNVAMSGRKELRKAPDISEQGLKRKSRKIGKNGHGNGISEENNHLSAMLMAGNRGFGRFDSSGEKKQLFERDSSPK